MRRRSRWREALGDRAGEAAALTGLAYAASFAGDVARASALAEQGLAALREVGDARALAEALVGVRRATPCTPAHYARAEALGGEALALFRALGDTGGSADALWTLGIAAQFQGAARARGGAPRGEPGAAPRARGRARHRPAAGGAGADRAPGWGTMQRARALLEEALAILRAARRPLGAGHVADVAGACGAGGGRAGARARAAAPRARRCSRRSATRSICPGAWRGWRGWPRRGEQWERAARLCGARDALRARLGPPLPPAHPAGYAGTLAGIRAALGDDGFAAAHEDGMALPLERALAEAAAIMAGAAGP